MRGLVPRWGRGGAWQNPPCQFAVPSHNSGFSYLGVPAPAGMSDWYESVSRTPIRDALKPLSSAPLNPNIPRSRHSGSLDSSFPRSKACPVPRYGGGNPRTNIPRTNDNRDTTTDVHTATPLRLYGNCAPRTQIRDRNPEEVYGWQMTRKQLHSSTPRFSHLGVPATTGISDWYESMSRTPIRDALEPLSSAPLNPNIPGSRHSRAPLDSGEGRNPEGRGWGNVVRSKTSRGEGLVPRWGRGGAWQNPPCQFAVSSHNSNPSYLGVPAPAGISVGTKACPGLRSGMAGPLC